MNKQKLINNIMEDIATLELEVSMSKITYQKFVEEVKKSIVKNVNESDISSMNVNTQNAGKVINIGDCKGTVYFN